MTNRTVYITRISALLPNQPISNSEIESVLGQIGSRPSRVRKVILRRNGIKSRHYVIDKNSRKITHTNAQLTADAVKKLFSKSFCKEQIECLVCGTSTPDQLLPNHSSMVHGELNNPACEAVSTAGVCLSGLAALKYAYLSVLAGVHERVVATGSETTSIVMQAENMTSDSENNGNTENIERIKQRPELAFEKDFLRWMLSDGAGATLLESKPNASRLSLKIDWIDMRSYANELETCMYQGAEKVDGQLAGWAHSPASHNPGVMCIKQDVKLLNENIINITVEKALTDIAEHRQLSADEIDIFVPHFSSLYFKEKVYTGLKNIGFEIPYEKWFTNLSEKGNTGSASIFIMLEELFNNDKLKCGQKILCYIPESGRFSSGYMLLTVV